MDQLHGNRLLAALPIDAAREILAHLQWVTLRQGQVLCAEGGLLGHAYFPVDSLISIVSSDGNDRRCAVAIVGSQGAVGTSVVLAPGRPAAFSALSIGSGRALRIEAQALQRLAAALPSLHAALLAYVHALIDEISRAAVCNQHHSTEQRLCKWFVTWHELGHPVVASHALLATMLGVRRESVSAACGVLRRDGLIGRAGRETSILRPGALRARACECCAKER